MFVRIIHIMDYYTMIMDITRRIKKDLWYNTVQILFTEQR